LTPPSRQGHVVPSRSSSGPRRGRTTIIIVAIAYALLSGLLLIDVMRFGEPRIYPPRKRAQSVFEIADQSGRVRAINPIIARGARMAGDPDVVLEVPEGYADLLAITPDNFAGRPVPTLNAGLMVPFIGGRVREAAYDPILSETQSTEIEDSPDAAALPRDVWVLTGFDDASVVRLYTDSQRMRVYVVPSGVVGEEVE